MPHYYLSRWRRYERALGGPWATRRSVLFLPGRATDDQDTWSVIDLRPDPERLDGLALLSLEARQDTPETDYLGDDLDGPSPAVRTRLASGLRLTLDGRYRTLRELLPHLLIDHARPGTRWNALQPGHHGHYEICLHHAVVWRARAIRGGASIAENFNKANNGLGPQLTWALQHAGEWKVWSNRAVIAIVDTTYSRARAETDLSADHEAWATYLANDAGYAARQHDGGPVVRMSSSSYDGYGGLAPATGGAMGILKLTGTGATTLGSGGTVPALPYTVKLQASGSTLTAFYNTTQAAQVTDTAYASRTRTGLFGAGDTKNTYFAQFDDFNAQDLTPASTELDPAGVASAEAIGTPTVAEPGLLLPAGITSAGAVGTPLLSVHTVRAEGVVSQLAIGTPAVQGQTAATIIRPMGIPSRLAIGSWLAVKDPTVHRVIVPALYGGVSEHGDLYGTRAEQGTNRWGLPSHATQCHNGTLGYLHYGFRGEKRPPPYSSYGGIHQGVTLDLIEGVHEANSWYRFPGCGIPKNATISTATLRWYANQIRRPYATGIYESSVWQWKIYALAEDVPAPGRVLDSATGYDLTYFADGYPTIVARIPRRPRADSREYDREHTAASVSFDYDMGSDPTRTGIVLTTPDLKTVLQELVNRAGWRSTSPIVLVVSSRAMWVNANWEAQNPYDPALLTDPPFGTPQVLNDYDAPVLESDTSKVARLDVTWT